MHETATLHFDLSHLAPDPAFTLHVGSSRYDLAPHTRQTLTPGPAQQFRAEVDA